MSPRPAALGELERALMDALWDADAALTVYDLQELLPERKNAATTLLTVLGRLERKGFVTVTRDSRPHRYVAASTRAEHQTVLLQDVLGTGEQREAVLARFVGGVSDDDAALLRRLLTEREG